ncbi:multiple sugar transport system ATP-binding protein [Geodermatophilus obscurus]|jgi:multiple sugar transport system ATP-binding protein|uniref:Multiple sugar transport system ATP-binding protein n=1 Tax=Geodermatophilus obscurus TaxID=1861 RepID=A0A1I5HGX0_9ACTN|nr:multiple sugar transport system ATP-binding protein [Geodermatophilus obscurus]
MTDTGVDGVTVVRGGATVLRDVTLLAADGELIVVLGSSGSGKTTLLRVVAGLDGVSSGEVLIRGRRVTRLPSGERHVAMVFQSSALLPFLDVAHNLGWSLRVQHRPEAEVQERVSGRARQLRLSRLLGRRPGQLSGGERGLVGIGRALVQVPDVLLLDEPLGDLDAVQRVEVRRQIVEVARSLGVPTFYVTHDPAEGLAIADRVALLHEGRIVQVGRPRELYERPVDLFVAEFIGAPQIGLLPARLVSAGGQAGFRVGARTLPLWQAVPPPLLGHVGREVVLGLRAEDVHPAEAGRDPDAVALDAVVSHVEYTGRQNVVAVQVEAAPDDPGGGLLGGGPSGGTLHSFFPPRAVIRSGDAVRITVDATRAHVFDPATGRALLHPPDRS